MENFTAKTHRTLRSQYIVINAESLVQNGGRSVNSAKSWINSRLFHLIIVRIQREFRDRFEPFSLFFETGAPQFIVVGVKYLLFCNVVGHDP